MIATRHEALRIVEPAYRARIRARARRKVLWLRRLWATGLVEQDKQSPVGHGDIDRILLSPDELAGLEYEFYASDDEAQALSPVIDATDQAWIADPHRRRLVEVFGLSECEMDLLGLVCAGEADPELRRVYGYLADEPGPIHASAWLAAHLFDWPLETWIGPDSPLVVWRWIRNSDGGSASLTPASACLPDPQAVAWLEGAPVIDPQLALCAQIVDPTSVSPGCLYPKVLSAMWDAADRLRPGPTQLELIGPPGAGRRTLAAQFASRLERQLLVVDAGLLAEPDAISPDGQERVIRAIRSALLLNAVLYWERADRMAAPASTPFLPDLQVVGLTARRPPSTATVSRTIFELPALTARQRCELWSWLRPEPPPAVVRDWALSPAEIGGAALVADAGEAAVNAIARGTLKDDSTELFTPLPQPFTWDDIVLTAATREHLSEFESQARLRWPVYEDWGFGSLCPLGRGVCALFSGPSGTGKTMAAQVIARSLGLDLYRVDLAGVVNKYIGETEKRLKRVFDACERANVMLLFDEADALFGQRTQVKDAHDRFANIEIDYLLQRMERFDGIAILATNRKGDLDKGFTRRLRFMVDFMNPGPEERMALWRKALPERSPTGEPLLDTIEWNQLAEKIVMTAAEIKLAALNAAFLARARDSRIGMTHVMAACRREAAKQGRELRGDSL
jgi:AAA+ superfamily predicted ATPase